MFHTTLDVTRRKVGTRTVPHRVALAAMRKGQLTTDSKNVVMKSTSEFL